MGQDRDEINMESTVKFAAAHKKMTLVIGAKVTALLIEHLRTTQRTTFPPVFRIVVGLC
jgi:hypothetical protein